MDVLFFNETPHVHPAARTRSCQGSSCVLFTVSSLETQKNKPQTDWPHFPPSEQKRKKKTLLSSCLSKWLKPSNRIQYVVIRTNKFIMGKAIHGPAVHVELSSQLEFGVVCQAQAGPQFYFGEKVCVMIWQRGFGFEPIIGKMNSPWESTWMFVFPPCSSCNHSEQRMKCCSFWHEPKDSAVFR